MSEVSGREAVRVLLVFLQVAGAGFALAAAYFWWQSARVQTPKTFSIHVVKPEMGILGEPLGGTYVGHGYSEELTNLGKALVWQSQLSGRAAICAAISAGIQGIAVLLEVFH